MQNSQFCARKIPSVFVWAGRPRVRNKSPESSPAKLLNKPKYVPLQESPATTSETSQKSHRHEPNMIACRAQFWSASRFGSAMPSVCLQETSFANSPSSRHTIEQCTQRACGFCLQSAPRQPKTSNCVVVVCTRFGFIVALAAPVSQYGISSRALTHCEYCS